MEALVFADEAFYILQDGVVWFLDDFVLDFKIEVEKWIFHCFVCDVDGEVEVVVSFFGFVFSLFELGDVVFDVGYGVLAVFLLVCSVNIG